MLTSASVLRQLEKIEKKAAHQYPDESAEMVWAKVRPRGVYQVIGMRKSFYPL